LFGTGLIDAIPANAMQQQANLQESHPEISGRLSILRDGTVGRFGWRANVNRLVNFVDRACANELSLETKRRPQGIDPTRPSYRNSSVDIEDAQVIAMASFVEQLPAPQRHMPEDETMRLSVTAGEHLFEQVGCAVCHVPNLGPARGVYSDILLHDMGPNLYDFDAAEPYVVGQKLSKEFCELPLGPNQTIGYYGTATSLDDFRASSSDVGRSNRILTGPRRSTATVDFVTLDKSAEILSAKVFRGSLNRSSIRSTASVREEIGIRRHLKPSNTSQEWRTAPLWGLRDSAPYMHDGRARTVLEAIAHHDGEAAGTRYRFLVLPYAQRTAILNFLDTLIAPPNAIQIPN
jgi:CxxC motif-containing protein (DUF1111 family)